MIKSKFNVEETKDPWDGNIKMMRIQHDISGKVFGETNSSYLADKICAENPGSKIINQWSEKTAELLFHT